LPTYPPVATQIPPPYYSLSTALEGEHLTAHVESNKPSVERFVERLMDIIELKTECVEFVIVCMRFD